MKEGVKALTQDLDEKFFEAKRHQQERYEVFIDMRKNPLDELKRDAERMRLERETKNLTAVRTWFSIASPWENRECQRSAPDTAGRMAGK